MQRILLGLVFVFLATGKSSAQTSSPVVEARMVLATDGAHAGSLVRAAAVAVVAPGYHINDHKPTLDYLIPTELKIEGTKHFQVEKVLYPEGESKKFAFSDTSLSVYEGTVVVGALLKVGRAVPLGIYALLGKLNYQACNDHACLPPASVPVTLKVKVVRRSVRLKGVNRDVFDRIKFD